MNQFDVDRQTALTVMNAAERRGFKDLRWTGKDDQGVIVTGRSVRGDKKYDRVRMDGVIMTYAKFS